MFSHFVLKNFKSIGDKPGIDLALKPLTLLVGPNNAGKSSILEGLALLAANVRRDKFQLSGELAKFSAYDQIAYKHDLSRWMSWEVLLGKNGVRYRHRPDTGEEEETVIKGAKAVVNFGLRGDRRVGQSLMVSFDEYQDIPVGGDFLAKLDGRKYEWERGLIAANVKAKLGIAEGAAIPDAPQVATVVEEVARKLVGSMFLLSSLRGDVPAEASTAQVPSWVGVRGEGLIPLLSVLQSPAYEEVWNKVERWAAEFGLLKLRAGLRGANKLAADFVDAELKTTVNLAFAGHGSRQIMSVITQLFWARPDSIIMIEEPELSLHPEAQVKLGELFAEAVKEDKQIIVSTHSHFLLLTLSRAVEKGLKASDIAAYHVTKDKDGTKAKPVKLNKRGYPLGWPKSYEKVERDLALNWSKGLATE